MMSARIRSLTQDDWLLVSKEIQTTNECYWKDTGRVWLLGAKTIDNLGLESEASKKSTSGHEVHCNI